MDVTLIERRGFREILSSKSVLANGTSFPRDSDFWSGSDVFPTSSPRCHRKRVYSAQKDIYQSRYTSPCEIHNSRDGRIMSQDSCQFLLDRWLRSSLGVSRKRLGKRLGNSRFSRRENGKGYETFSLLFISFLPLALKRENRSSLSVDTDVWRYAKRLE